MIIVYTDGGSRGNPGPAAYGVFITNEGKETLAAFGKYIGTNTNNVAEYTAVVEAFNWLIAHRDLVNNSSGIYFYMDSQLVCRQLNGQYKIKHPVMQDLYYTVQRKMQELGMPVQFQHVYREYNKMADKQVNIALDKALSESLQ